MSDDKYVIKFKKHGYPCPYVSRIHKDGGTSNVSHVRNARPFDTYADADRARRHLMHKDAYVALTIEEAEAREIAHALTSSS